MDGFKLLAIRPLEGCNPDYCKILLPNVFYTFYNNYSFSNNKTGKIKVEYSPSIEDLYEIQNNGKNININVSAIVGKNGSGKSTLLELYYLCMYFIAINRKKPFLEPNLISIKRELEMLDETDLDTVSRKDNLTNKKKEIEKIIESFKIQLFYSVDENIYLFDTSKTKIDDLEYDFVELLDGGKSEKRKFIISTIFEETDKFDPTNFAYSCVINYSTFGLNALELGSWISTLFHKNDAYRTPIVINPMRTNGDFVIEEENELLSGRILQSLAICLKQNKNDDIGKLLGTERIPEKITFRLKKSVRIGGLTPKMDGSTELLFSEKNIYENGEIKYLTFKKFLNNILSIEIDKIIDNNLLLRYCLEYAFSKSERIFDKYPIFRGEASDEEFIKLLLNDRSHITLKFRQAINFITEKLFSKLTSSFFDDKKKDIDLIEINESDYKKIIEYSLDEIKKIFEKKDDEISFVPPPIFEIDFVFSENPHDKLNLLSSGESQSTHSLNAIYYHLRNIDSINKTQLDFDYKYVNLILDEIELYHHPEMQRTYLFRLLEGIKALNLKKIKGINILFSTHSPFILSDIPDSNILRLENGKPSIKPIIKTFGANIYDLLKGDFFLEKGFVGQFAMSKIREIILYTNKGEYIDEKHNLYLKIVEIIGDDIIKNKIIQLLDDIRPKNFKEDELIKKLENQKQEIENQLKKLRNDNNS